MTRGRISKDDPRHGTANGYGNLVCRCDSCKLAYREVQLKQVAERKARGLAPGDERHGTYNAYANYGCRCDECRRANAEYARDYKNRRPRPERKVKWRDDARKPSPPGLPLTARLARLVEPQPNGCWKWMGSKANGYGRITIDGASLYVHRVSWELFNQRQIPETMVIDHRCGNRYCCNPDHLDLVTVRENTLRSASAGAKNAVKTHCPQGHPYTGANVRVNGGRRYCIACTNDRNRRYREAKKVE